MMNVTRPSSIPDGLCQLVYFGLLEDDFSALFRGLGDGLQHLNNLRPLLNGTDGRCPLLHRLDKVINLRFEGAIMLTEISDSNRIPLFSVYRAKGAKETPPRSPKSCTVSSSSWGPLRAQLTSRLRTTPLVKRISATAKSSTSKILDLWL